MKTLPRRRFTLGAALMGVSVLFIGLWGVACDDVPPTAPAGVTTDAQLGVVPRGERLASTFDTDADGWTLFGDANGAAGVPHGDPVGYSLQPFHDATAGNTGGAVYAVDDAAGQDWYWQAPPKLLGHRPNLYDWSLSFDLKVPVSPNYPNRPDVILAGDGLTLVMDAGPNPPAETWQRFTVGLSADQGWKVTRLDGADATEAQIRGVLSDLSVLRIRGEYFIGVDTGYLDNVRFHRRR